MPSSHSYQISTIVGLISLTNPKSVLDIGAGFGKYGVLAREYLEVSSGGFEKSTWKHRIDAIEGFKDYLSPIHEYIYDHIYVGDAFEILPHLENHYDLILLIDVLEHFEYEQGVTLLRKCLGLANNVLVSTPQRFFNQYNVFGNSYEIHKSVWKKKHFAQFGQHLFIPDEFSLICYMGESCPIIKKEVFKLKRRIKFLFPYLVYPYRGIKSIFHFFK